MEFREPQRGILRYRCIDLELHTRRQQTKCEGRGGGAVLCLRTDDVAQLLR